MDNGYLKGRGAQINVKNRFLKSEYVSEYIEGIDEPMISERPKTELFFENPKNIISKNDSPDLGWMNSINPYQGCEHGCIYCYARNSHQYWGFNSGIDFETKIIIKREAVQLLERKFLSNYWKPSVIVLSGNTDCYQPLEKEFELTRGLLEVMLKYRNPVGMITKNALITRDLDLLKELARLNLVTVHISLTTLDEKLRSVMEPRTSTSAKRLDTIQVLADAGIPVGVMVAPIIPGLNNHGIPGIIKQAAERGALSVGYNVIRLNGQLNLLFKDWLVKNFPDRATRVWNLITTLHGGKVNDSEWGRRLKGDGNIAESIRQMIEVSKKKYLKDKSLPHLDLTRFRKNWNYTLFG